MARKEQIEIVSDPETDGFDSESDVTEDEDGLDLTPALDAAILRTLGKIRRGEGVYNAEQVLQQELAAAETEALKKGIKARQAKREESKPFLLADHHRAALLSGRANEEEVEEEMPLTHVQEERMMRREAIAAFNAFGADAEEEGEFEPVNREKGIKDVDSEEEGYRQFLLEMGGGEDEVRRLLGMGDQPVSIIREEEAEEEKEKENKESEKKRKKRQQRKKKEEDDFLMNYILNRGWIDKEDRPTTSYGDIPIPKPDIAAAVSDVESDNEAGPSHPWGQLDEDEFDEKAEEFETQYNFRFEEPGAADITSHPRQIPSLVRRADDTRKLKREARAERKAAAQAEKEEEIRRTKGKKRREMEAQLSALRKEIGEKGWQKVEKVLDVDYDEDEWENVIGEVLAGLEDGGDAEDDDEKPTWDEEDEYGEEVYGEGEEKQDDLEDAEGPINMDADFVGFEEETKKKTKKKDKGKGKKQQEVVEEIEEEDLTATERAQKVKEAMKDYKALDHEDMIGDLPTRFHYTQTAPTAFGLSAAEILMATDEELNQLMSVKHIAPYRRGGLGMQGKGLGKRVRDLKDSLAGRKWGEEDWKPQHGQAKDDGRHQDQGWGQRRVNGGEAEPKKKRAGKNERKRKAAAAGLGTEGNDTNDGGAQGQGSIHAMVVESEQGLGDAVDGEGEGKKKRRKKRKSEAYHPQ